MGILYGFALFCVLGLQWESSLVEGQVNRPNAARVLEIRKHLMYPYSKDDWKSHITSGMAQYERTSPLTIPVYGFNFNYTWINLFGYVAFSHLSAIRDGQKDIKFPVSEWPERDDPSLIAPFMAQAQVGVVTSAQENRDFPPGLYIKFLEGIGDKNHGNFQEELDIKEALRLDVQEGMVGAIHFEPKHVIIITWKNVTFPRSDDEKRTNTYQMVLTTDEIRTYVMFNYELMNWFSSNGNNEGLGGYAAFIGFNAGNGTRAFEYKPYSQNRKIYDLTSQGFVNGFPGRHMFRIDEEILQGTCNFEPPETSALEQKIPLLVMAPESGHMLGGTIVNVTGPCFNPERNQRVARVKFHDREILCPIYHRNLATCVTPMLFVGGYVDVKGGQDNNFLFANKFYIENPMVASETIRFLKQDFVNSIDADTLDIEWSSLNLTWNTQAQVDISIWGYRENDGKPDLVHIRTLAEGLLNNGHATVDLVQFKNADDGWKRDFTFGLLQINTSIPIVEGHTFTPILWSRPIPLAWYFGNQWQRYMGSDWAVQFCKRWDTDDRRLRTFANEVPRCPCTLEQAESDKGRFVPDFACDQYGNTECYGHKNVLHCVRSGQPTIDGGGQQCCYGLEKNLMMNVDFKESGIPNRAHPFGIYPYEKSSEVPGLSFWLHDQSAYFACCGWQSERNESCYQFKWRRASQDCIGYQPPGAATVFGDPHIITFDDQQYTFNGLGDFSLVSVHDKAHNLDVQGRFERMIDMERKVTMKATLLTAVVAKDNISLPVEIQMRPHAARWRYRLNVLVDRKRVYFDRQAHKIQTFKGVTVYVPSNIHTQSHVIAMFGSGAGVEVLEHNGYLSARVYLPKTYMNITRGLMGNWSSDSTDDLVPPKDENLGDIPIQDSSENSFERLHRDFGLLWMVSKADDNRKGLKSYFHEENTGNRTFAPEFLRYPYVNESWGVSEDMLNTLCGAKGQPSAYQCRYDYTITRNKLLAEATKKSLQNFIDMKQNRLTTVITCGALETPRHGKKSTFKYTIGTEVKMDCDKGYILEGEPTRWCYPAGEWSWTEYGITRCLSQESYYSKQAGITSGIVLGILIPVIIGAVCLFCYVVAKGKSDVADSPRHYYGGESHKMERVRTSSDSQDPDPKKKSRETEA